MMMSGIWAQDEVEISSCRSGYKMAFFDAHTRLNQARSVEPLEFDSFRV